jgi:hypothetical protein
VDLVVGLKAENVRSGRETTGIDGSRDAPGGFPICGNRCYAAPEHAG